MAPLPPGRRRSLPRGWLPALVLSLLLHMALTFAFVHAQLKGPQGAGDSLMVVDSLVLAAAEPFQPSLALRRIPSAKAAPRQQTLPPSAPPSLPWKPTLDGPRPPARFQVATRSTGMAEEQEEPADADARGMSGGDPEGANGQGSGSTRFLRIAAEGPSVVFVIDRSASMGKHGSLALARRELLASLEHLRSDVQFQVIAYNRVAEPLVIGGHDTLVPATAENKQAVEDFLSSLHAEGGTNHLHALRRALQLHAQVIFFLTDGDDISFQEIHQVTLLNRGRATIHAIELGDRPRSGPNLPLEGLARANHGLFQYIQTTSR